MYTPDYSVSAAQSTVRATVSRALAKALITGIHNAEQEEHSLTELQQIDLATMHIMAYDEAIEACEVIAVEAEVLERAKELDLLPPTSNS